MIAIIAIKKTVAPILSYFVCSPGEHLFKNWVSAPEQKIKTLKHKGLILKNE
jgi:hypothetical protein